MTTGLRGRARLALVDELSELAELDDVVGTLLRSAQLAAVAGRDPQPAELVDELNGLLDDGPIAGVLAIEVLGAIDHGAAVESLTALLSAPHTLIRRHAAWRLRRRPAAAAAVPPLLDMIVVGGIDTMHAHRTLRRWAVADPAITGFAIDRLSATGDGRRRARLIDLLGAIDDPRTTEILVRLAADVTEFTSARIAAIGALADRYGTDEAALRRLAARDDEVGAHATLAVCDRARAATVGGRAPGSGLRIAQLTMAAGLDGQLSLGGRGDTGGVASLLVSLGEALASRPEIDHVLTIGRGTVTDAILGSSHSALVPFGEPPLTFATIAIGDDGRPAETTDDLWEHLPTIERVLRRIIRRAGGIDLLHLRMADAGTLAGAHAAAAEDIPTCFSLAPDPHNVLSSLRARGEADQGAVLRLATESHIWFRARLVERLARESDRVALFPRSKPVDFFTGCDAAPGRFDQQRCAVVAEGIDIGLIRRAEAADSAAMITGAPRGDVLADLVSGIPDDRCDLPLLVSVGRLNPVKGMDRVVAAWASQPLLHERFNLVIVGGDLENPSPTERSVLEAIDRLVPVGDVRRTGLRLLGGRPRADVARLLVSAARGLAGCWAAGGVYVDGAWKEEFGLAVIEALAAGLVVVAPSTGGPPTYIDDGDIGVLVDPTADLGDAIIRALGLVDRPGRTGRARRLIEQRYSVETMAERLAALYRPLAVVR